jgi:hypothetical protein
VSDTATTGSVEAGDQPPIEVAPAGDAWTPAPLLDELVVFSADDTDTPAETAIAPVDLYSVRGDVDVEEPPAVAAPVNAVEMPAPSSSSWFVVDGQPYDPGDADADVPLATGGFRAFAERSAREDVTGTTDSGPAMRAAFVFPDVADMPRAAGSYFGLDTDADAPLPAVDLAADATEAEVDASANTDASPVLDSEPLADAGTNDEVPPAFAAVAVIEEEPIVEIVAAVDAAVDPDVDAHEEPAVAAEVDEPVVVEAVDVETFDGATVGEGDAPGAPKPSGESGTDILAVEHVIDDVVDVVLAESVEEPAAAPAPGAEPDPPVPVEAEPAPLPEVLPDVVPEVVIVDGGLDRNAWDHLPSELPVVDGDVVEDGLLQAAATETDAETLAAEDDEHETEPAVAVGVNAAAMAASGSKKKRKRSRRKKGQPPVAAPVAAPVRISAPEPVVLPRLALEAVASAPVEPVLTVPPVVEASSPNDVPAPSHRGRSLLDREVPTWTPSEHIEMRVRPLLPRPEVVAPEADLGSTGIAAAAAPARDVVALPSAVGPTSAAAGAMPPPNEHVLLFEPEIRAVGMPDVDEALPKGRNAAVTSMADALGSTVSSARSGPVERSHVTLPPPAEARTWNWRRVAAAAVFFALFNGVAFAAWWWVQPGAYGTLVVQTAQAGVEVALDGKAIGKTPFREEVAPGRHTLTLRHNGQSREMPVEISLGVVTTQALEWPLPDGGARGSLQVTSTPTGAKVYVNGELRGEAPLLLDDLPAGKQELTLRGDAGTVTVAATVVAGETTPLDVPIFAGWVVVDAAVEMNLLLRGAKIGSTMDGQILLSPGRHQIEAVSDTLGFRRTLSVTIEPGEVKRVAVSVPPASLQVQDEPGSEVFVDGDRVGTLPGVLKVPLGTHDVLVKRPDGTERRQTVTVRAGGTATM